MRLGVWQTGHLVAGHPVALNKVYKLNASASPALAFRHPPGRSVRWVTGSLGAASRRGAASGRPWYVVLAGICLARSCGPEAWGFRCGFQWTGGRSTNTISSISPIVAAAPAAGRQGLRYSAVPIEAHPAGTSSIPRSLSCRG